MAVVTKQDNDVNNIWVDLEFEEHRPIDIDKVNQERMWMQVYPHHERKQAGLYLSTPLSTDIKKYSMSQAMKTMITGFQKRIGLKLYDDVEYKRFLALDMRIREFPVSGTGHENS